MHYGYYENWRSLIFVHDVLFEAAAFIFIYLAQLQLGLTHCRYKNMQNTFTSIKHAYVLLNA